jgi:hypothetical protein
MDRHGRLAHADSNRASPHNGLQVPNQAAKASRIAV